jgi:hypothetical protein
MKKVSKGFALASRPPPSPARFVPRVRPQPDGARRFTPPALSDDIAASPAASREEVVYANLSAAGAVRDVNVVSILHNAAAGAVADFGNFASVKNLTDTGPVTLEDDKVFLNAPSGDFYYQGTLKTPELPWNIGISYTLDGTAIAADALAGQSGHVAISIKTSQNANTDPVYFDNYPAANLHHPRHGQMRRHHGPGGVIANAGASKLVTFTVMPGNAGELLVETDAVDFSMSGIELSAVPLSMQLEAPDTSDHAGRSSKARRRRFGAGRRP